MFRKSFLLIGLTLLVAMVGARTTGTAFAQEPPPLTHTAPFWDVYFWNNTSLSGDAVASGSDAGLDFDWGHGAPRQGVNSDGFSARWTRYLDLQAGTYQFTATSDDGVRVSIDGRLIIDEWHDHPAQTYAANVALSQGHHLVTVEYYENQGEASIRVFWTLIPPSFKHWRGEYFDNRWLSGLPFLVRDDAAVKFDWGYGSPATGMPTDGFSARWTRTVHFPPGSYRFTAGADDGVRLWVNGHLLIDQWHDQAFTSHSATIHLAGDVPIKMEYYENGEVAAARLAWVQVTDDTPGPAPGVIVVDDVDPGFVKGGSAAGWRTAWEGHGGRLTWTWNNDWRRSGYNWGRWYPELTPGRYEVFVYVPERYTTTSVARYWVRHRDGYTLRRVNQSTTGSRWISLGTYWFRGTREDYVSLSDVTFERHRSRLIAFDAVRWEPR